MLYHFSIYRIKNRFYDPEVEPRLMKDQEADGGSSSIESRQVLPDSLPPSNEIEDSHQSNKDQNSEQSNEVQNSEQSNEVQESQESNENHDSEQSNDDSAPLPPSLESEETKESSKSGENKDNDDKKNSVRPLRPTLYITKNIILTTTYTT